MLYINNVLIQSQNLDSGLLFLLSGEDIKALNVCVMTLPAEISRIYRQYII